MTSSTATVRPLEGPDDLAALIALNDRCELDETGEIDQELTAYLRGSAQDYRAFGIEDAEGLVAFAWVELTPGSTGLEGDVRVRPGVDPEIARPLLEQIKATARAYDDGKPLHLFANHVATAIRLWWASLGAVEIRHFWRMAIDLDDQPPAVPGPAEGVTLRTARHDEADLRTIYSVVHTSFAEHFGRAEGRTYEQWYDAWHRREDLDLSLWWVAEVDATAAAVLLGMTYPDCGHVGTLGTLKEFRGRGLGSTLLRTGFAEFHRRGFRKVTLGVDASNETGAVRLYESVGMAPTTDWVCYELSTG